MTRPQQIRAIYAELKQRLGDQMTSRELLESAAFMVDAFESADKPKFGSRAGGVPFEEWPLDRAFADGGWRVMSHEATLVARAIDPIEPAPTHKTPWKLEF